MPFVAIIGMIYAYKHSHYYDSLYCLQLKANCDENLPHTSDSPYTIYQYYDKSYAILVYMLCMLICENGIEWVRRYAGAHSWRVFAHMKVFDFD